MSASRSGAKGVELAHVLRDQGVLYQAYISQISYLLFLKMDDERAGLAAYGIKNDSAIPKIAAGLPCAIRRARS